MPFNPDLEFRESNRFTGDGLPGEPSNAPLPFGDPTSGAYHVPKRAFREFGGRIEDAILTAEGIREYVEGIAADIISATEVPIFSTVTAVTGYDVPDGMNVIFITGLTTAGDGGAYYKRNGSSTHPYRFTDGGGGIWEPTTDPAPMSALTGSTAGLSVDIGTGGDFADLQAAYDALANYIPRGHQGIELRIVSPLTKGLLVRSDADRFFITSAIGTVPLASGFVGVSNFFFENYGANTLATVYKHTQNLIVGHRAKLPRLQCLINMNSPRGTARLGHGITTQGGEAYIGGGAGILNAGLCGISVSNSRVFAIESVFSGSGAENIRIQQASSVTFQGATSDDGEIEAAALGDSISGAAVFVSRGSSANLIGIKVRNSRKHGVEAHRAFVAMTAATVTGSAEDNCRFILGSHAAASGSDIRNAGRDGVVVSQGSIVSLNDVLTQGCTRHSLNMYGGGGWVSFEGATTKTGATGVPALADINGVADFNWISPNGVVTANIDGPLQRLDIRAAGIFSGTGATNGKKFVGGTVLDSSRDGTDTQQHMRFFNANGLRASIITTAASAAFGVVCDGRLKGNLLPAAEEMDALEWLRSIQLWGFNWPDGRRGLGVIAQDFHKIAPDSVFVGDDGPVDGPDFVQWQVGYTDQIPKMMLVDQALLERLLAVEARLAAIEGAR